jgi:hypothetical protein
MNSNNFAWPVITGEMVVVSAKCPTCGGKVFGMAETEEQAQKRLEWNFSQHQLEHIQR